MAAVCAAALAPGVASAGDPPWVPVGGPALAPGQTGPHGNVVRFHDHLYTITEEGDPAHDRREAVVWEQGPETSRRVGNSLSLAGQTVRNARLAVVGDRLHALWLQTPTTDGPWELHVAVLVHGDHDMVRWESIGAPFRATEAAIGGLDGRPLIAWIDPDGAPQAAWWQPSDREWRPVTERPLDTLLQGLSLSGGPARVPQVMTGAAPRPDEATIMWVQFDRVVSVWLHIAPEEAHDRGALRLNVMALPRERASDTPRGAEAGEAPPGLAAPSAGYVCTPIAFTGPWGEIYAEKDPEAGRFVAVNRLLDLGDGRQPSTAFVGHVRYLAFVVRRRIPHSGSDVFRVVVVRHRRGQGFDALPLVDDGQLTPYGHQLNPTVVSDGTGLVLVYDVHDPAAGIRGRVTRAVRLNPDAG